MSDRILTDAVTPVQGMLRRIAAAVAGVVRERVVVAPPKRQSPDIGLDHVTRPARREGGGRGPRGARVWLRSAWRRHRSRRQITRLSPHLLRDIGVTYAEAEAEANKRFWQR